jgi:WD40 repeat protein
VVVFDDWQDDPAAALRGQIATVVGAEPAASLAETLELCAALAGGEIFVVLDALEEYFLYHGAGEDADEFLEDFAQAVGWPGLRASFLLSIREDALAKLDRFKGRIPNVLGNYLRLDHLDRASASEAIVGPIDRLNDMSPDEAVEIEPALVEAVLDQVAAGKVELGESGRGGVEEPVADRRIEAPFLQLVMTRLWETERAAGSRVLRLASLVELGGASQIVRDHLDHALDALSPHEQDLAASMFNHLVTPSGAKIAHDAADLAGYVGAGEADVEPVLASLAAQRILRPVPGVPGSDLPRYEIYHDILAEGVLAWRTRHESARALARVREMAAKRHRRLLVIAVAAVLLAGAMAIVTIFAFSQRSEAERQRARARRESSLARANATKAEARALDASALSQLSSDPELSLVLSVDAANLDPGPRAKEVLRQALAASRERGIFKTRGAVSVVEFRGGRILVAGADGWARLYDAAHPRRQPRKLHHGAPITAGDISPSGNLILTGGKDGTVKVWSPKSGQPLQVLRVGHPVQSAVFAADGEHVLTAAGFSAQLWRVGAGLPVWTHRRGWPVTRAVLSHDGHLVAVIGNSPQAVLLDESSGGLVHIFDQGDFVKSVAFSPNDAYLVTGGRAHAVEDRRSATARVWDVRQHDRVAELKNGHTEDIVAIAFSPSGQTIATGSLDGTARTWTLAGTKIGTFSGHTGAVNDVAFSPDGTNLLTASSDRTVRVWKNTSSSDQVALLAGHKGAVKQAVYSPDGTRVVTASDDGTARLWDPRQPTLRVLKQEGGPILGAWYAGRGRIAVAGPGSTVGLIRASDGKRIREVTLHATVTAGRPAPDGKVLAIATGGRIHLFRLPDLHPLASFGRPAKVTAMAFSADHSRLATAGKDGIARIWRTDGHLLHELKLEGHARPLTDVALSPNGRLVATSSEDKTARIWDARNGRYLRTLTHKKPVTSVTFSPNSRLVLTAGEDWKAHLWRARTGKAVGQPLSWHFTAVADANFSPDGGWVVTIGQRAAQIWQPHLPDPIYLFSFGIGGPSDNLTSAVFDRTSRTVLVASKDGTVRTYYCALCGGRDELLPLARGRLRLTGRTLTTAERKQYGG